MAIWITDVAHLPPNELGVPVAARDRAEFTREVVEAATSRVSTKPWLSAVPCIGPKGDYGCGRTVEVMRKEAEVVWSCAGCGEEGTVTGFRGTRHDLSGYVARGETVPWGIDEDEREFLRNETEQHPEQRAVVMRARPHASELLVIEATGAELDAMYTFVERLSDTTDRVWEEVWDGLLSSLSHAIDGF
jgi:hypothetical protein